MTTQPDTQHCPYLGIETNNNRPGEAIEYPSFENRCWTNKRPIPLLLTDQATLCLCNGYMNCPRFLAARAERQGQEPPATIPTPSDSDTITSALKELEADVQAANTAHVSSRRRWGWIGAGLIFMSSLLCGGLFAAYVGWQMVRDELAATPPGQINTLASPAQAQTQPDTYIIVTATSEPIVVAQNQPTTQDNGTGNRPENGQAPSYPEAIQPTPSQQQPPPSLSQIAQDTNATAQVNNTGTNGTDGAIIENSAQPTPILDFQLEIPTRRPTPILDIPTSTPSVEETPTQAPTPTPIPPMGTPVVIFYADDQAMDPGDCTTVYWHVENVKAVYYENIGVDGRGQKEECVRNDPGQYNLMLILANGATQWYTVTVGIVQPTQTPTPRPTYAEEPSPTPTWTPNVPTATPTPPTVYGVRLEASSKTDVQCARGATCEFDFYVSNTGNAIDSITLRFTEASSWPHQLCRLDGVCSDMQMTLVDVSQTATGVLRLRITVPQDAGADTMTYKVQAVSDKSSGITTSSTVGITITAVDDTVDDTTE